MTVQTAATLVCGGVVAAALAGLIPPPIIATFAGWLWSTKMATEQDMKEASEDYMAYREKRKAKIRAAWEAPTKATSKKKASESDTQAAS